VQEDMNDPHKKKTLTPIFFLRLLGCTCSVGLPYAYWKIASRASHPEGKSKHGSVPMAAPSIVRPSTQMQPETRSVVKAPMNEVKFDATKYRPRYEIPWGSVLPIHPNKTKVWIDVGTNVDPIVAPNKNVYMILIEPQPRLAAWNEEAFPDPGQVACVWSAISETQGTVTLNVYEEYGKASSLSTVQDPARYKKANSLAVPSHSLKDVLHMVPKHIEIEMLKTDVQGFDFMALKSAGDELKRVKLITSELTGMRKDLDYNEYKNVQNDWQSVSKYLEGLGFKRMACGPQNCQYMNNAICNATGGCNYFALRAKLCRQPAKEWTKRKEGLAECKKRSTTPFQRLGDICTVCELFIRYKSPYERRPFSG
jgi:FkbM family methyltransferase